MNKAIKNASIASTGNRSKGRKAMPWSFLLNGIHRLHTQEAKGATSASKVYLFIHMVSILGKFDFKNSPSIC